MKQLLSMTFAVAALAAGAAPIAHAEQAVPEPVGKMTPPPFWQVDAGRSRALEGTLAREEHFGGAPVDVSAQYLTAPGGGALLLVSEIATRAVPADADALASAELHAVRGGLSALGDTVTLVHWSVMTGPGIDVPQARLEWTDASLGTTTIGRTLVFQTAQHLVRLRGECLLGADASAHRAPCEAALKTLEPLAGPDALVPLTIGDVPAEQVAERAARFPYIAGVSDTPAERPGAQIRERSGDLPIAITVDAPKPKTDRRPIYVGLGLVLIAAAYLWNRRNKERLAAPEERDDKPAGDRTRAEYKAPADDQDEPKKPDEDLP